MQNSQVRNLYNSFNEKDGDKNNMLLEAQRNAMVLDSLKRADEKARKDQNEWRMKSAGNQHE